MNVKRSDSITRHLVSSAARGLLAAAVVASATACGGGGDGGGGGGGGAVYLLGTNVFSDSGTTGYAVPTTALAGGEELTLAQAAEFAGGIQLFADDSSSGVVFIGDSEAPVLTRYRVSASGGLTADGELSFANQGLTSINLRHEHIQFVSATKAYLFSSEFGEIIAWNPATMEIVDTIAVPGLTVEEPWNWEFGYIVFRRGTELVTTFNYRASDFYGVQPRSVLVVLDTATDEVVTDVLEGCGEMTLGTQAANGDIYWATGVHGVSVHRTTPDFAPAPCLRRVLASESVFDATFAKDPRELTGDRPAGDLVGRGDGTALIRVYHEDEAPLAETDNGFNMRRKQGWRWWSVDLTDLTATELTESPFSGSNTLLFRVDGEAYLLRLAADFSSSTLELLPAGGVPTPVLTVPGVLQGGLVRAR